MVSDRINQLIMVMGVDIVSFSAPLGGNSSEIFNVLKGERKNPSLELIQNILKVYHKVDADWLLRGEGGMWNQDVVTSYQITPYSIDLNARIKKLFLKLNIVFPESGKVTELEELVKFMLEEYTVQKSKLVLLYERQEAIIEVLIQKLKLNEAKNTSPYNFDDFKK